jgi:hypothetical protein
LSGFYLYFFLDMFFCRLFERAISAVGLDFKSDDLWDAYIAWEKSIGQTKNIFGVYERLLRIPTLHYQRHFDGYEKSFFFFLQLMLSSYRLEHLLQQSPVQELITAEELEMLRPHVPEVR